VNLLNRCKLRWRLYRFFKGSPWRVTLVKRLGSWQYLNTIRAPHGAEKRALGPVDQFDWPDMVRIAAEQAYEVLHGPIRPGIEQYHDLNFALAPGRATDELYASTTICVGQSVLTSICILLEPCNLQTDVRKLLGGDPGDFVIRFSPKGDVIPPPSFNYHFRLQIGDHDFYHAPLAYLPSLANRQANQFSRLVAAGEPVKLFVGGEPFAPTGELRFTVRVFYLSEGGPQCPVN
jgi:hypothetical protein